MFDELLKAMQVEETEKTAEDTLVEDVAAADTFGRVAAYGYLEKMAEEMEVEEQEGEKEAAKMPSLQGLSTTLSSLRGNFLNWARAAKVPQAKLLGTTKAKAFGKLSKEELGRMESAIKKIRARRIGAVGAGTVGTAGLGAYGIAKTK